MTSAAMTMSVTVIPPDGTVAVGSLSLVHKFYKQTRVCRDFNSMPGDA